MTEMIRKAADITLMLTVNYYLYVFFARHHVILLINLLLHLYITARIKRFETKKQCKMKEVVKHGNLMSD